MKALPSIKFSAFSKKKKRAEDHLQFMELREATQVNEDYSSQTIFQRLKCHIHYFASWRGSFKSVLHLLNFLGKMSTKMTKTCKPVIL